ncbi:MAG TPA: hypothetical protein VE621_19865 [Bryobacteraceae bacterium]|nr:hypothetical protein [Bryobacteraceae bacterium]
MHPLKRIHLLVTFLLLTALLPAADLAPTPGGLVLNQGKPMLDAHNCYPNEGRWANRIDRALSTGFPLAIEQDIAWHIDPATGNGRAVVSHEAKSTGSEPTLNDYFFERIRPMVEAELAKGDRSRWPIIVLNLDFKDVRPELLKAVWNVLGQYDSWLTTAAKTPNESRLEPLDVKPVLVLGGSSDAQQKVFYDDLPVGARLRIFGAAHDPTIPGSTTAERAHAQATMPPGQLLSEKPTNYRRWWNNPWAVVEEGGQGRAGDWTAADDERLRALVTHSHKLGFWIRFYTLNGHSPAEDQGWSTGYNFGSRDAVLARWRAAYKAGVDFIATDQYEDLARILNPQRTR